jgi:cardiolipin synthase C
LNETKPSAFSDWALLVALCGFSVVFTGCASLPEPKAEWNQPQASTTVATAWSRALAQPVAQHPEKSGVRLLTHGLDALSARLAIADTAEATLDVQYYIWKPDETGHLLADRLVRAADRGVKVRLLLDDVGTAASDDLLLALNTHSNIEIRLFNPISNRLFRRFSALADFQRVNRRMHNKSFTADRSITIVGGRNIGDHYFSSGEEREYVDLDVIAAGPVAAEVTAMFDLYWSAPTTFPIYALNRKEISAEKAAAIESQLRSEAGQIAASPRFTALANINRRSPALSWGPVKLLYDLPEKVMRDRKDTAAHLLPQLREVSARAQKEIFVISPYFVPGDTGVEFFRSRREQGNRVIILANSLASNDVTPVHVGYSRYRKPLLRAGVELYELKPTIQVRAAAQDKSRRDHSAGSGLHAKAFIFDRTTLFVTSFNLDPRSASLNTEMGLLIEIPELAASFAEALEKNLPETTYRVEFVPGPGPCKECGSLVWIGHENGVGTRYTNEPETTFARRLLVSGLSLLPIEDQL